jgi:hypothetical protein
MFICGNDAEAKATVIRILKEWFGWQSVIDLGDIRAARATEMMLPIWTALWSVLETPIFGFRIIKGSHFVQ